MSANPSNCPVCETPREFYNSRCAKCGYIYTVPCKCGNKRELFNQCNFCKKVKKVWYKHYRYNDKGELFPYSRGRENWQPSSKGGLTTCVIEDDEGRIFIGEAECSKRDNFVYAIGRKIAFGRAEKQMRKYYNELPF